MELCKLAVVLVVMILMFRHKHKIWVALLVTGAVAATLFSVGVVETLTLAVGSITSATTIQLLILVYSIGFLQKAMTARDKMKDAEIGLTGVFNNQQFTAIFCPIFMGLLPAPNSILLAAPIVDGASENIFDPKQRAFVSSYLRHIPECILPTYAQVILASELAGVELGAYLLAMFPMAAAMVLLVYIAYIRKIPKQSAIPITEPKGYYAKLLLTSTWPILSVILLLLVLKIPIYLSTIITTVVFLLVNRFTLREVKALAVKAFQLDILLNTAVVMLFKDVIIATGVVSGLVVMFDQLPIPQFLIYGLVFFAGVVLSGSQGMVALLFPIAFLTMSGNPLPLAVFFMCLANSAMNLSPTHICLYIVSDYYGIAFKDLIRKTVPVIATHVVIAVGYYLLLTAFL